MRGYHTSYGYKGYVYGRWMLFSTEADYNEYMKDLNKNEDIL